MIDTDSLEADILLKMIYEEYEPFNEYLINKDEDGYYVVFNEVSAHNPNNTRIFLLEDLGNNVYRVKIDDRIYNYEEYQYLIIFKLSAIERLFVLSCLIGNEKSEQYLPDFIREKVKMKGVKYGT